MKNLLIYLLSVAVALPLWQCSKNEDSEPSTPTIEISNASPITILASGGNQKVRFTTNSTWTASIKNGSSWLSVSPTSGQAGTVELTIATTAANTSYDNLTDEVVITAGTLTKSISVTQKKKDALILSQNQYAIKSGSQTIEISVQHNVDLTVQIPDGAKQWITQTTAKGLTTDVLYFSIAAYTDGTDARTATITIKDKASDLSDEFTVTQQPTPTLTLAPSSVRIPAGANEGALTMLSTEPWTITPATDNPAGCTLSALSGAKGITVVTATLTSDKYADAAWSFTVKADTMIRTFTVTRAAHRMIVASPNDFTARAKGGMLDIALQRSVECEVIIPATATWLKQIINKGLVSETLHFEIAANPETAARSCNIIIRNPDDHTVADTVAVTQASIYIPTVTDGWDIYVAGNYRYGPSIIINDNGSIDAWFAAAGGVSSNIFKPLYNTTNSHTAVSNKGGTAAQKFTIDKPFWGVVATSPNWNGKPCGMTFKLFKWDETGGYTGTIAQTPLAERTFTNYDDGALIGVSNDDMYPAGTYLWLITDMTTEQSGLWLISGVCDGVVSYKNGAEISGNWEARCAYKQTSFGSFWDQISYQHSTDNGENWTPEEMTIQPTDYSRDAYSCCDPGAIFFGGHYYVGYTSTEDKRGLDNHLYVARSTNPNGPWEKWNSTGWGGNPQPVVTYTGNHDSWGVGEPSFVVYNNSLYVYYSWNDGGTQTRVSTAPINDANWPLSLTYQGVAIDKSAIDGADHCDVKYNDDLKKFVAIHTASRMTDASYMVVWMSNDGINFQKVTELRDNLKKGLHNCGWSGDPQGHMRAGVQQYVAYAYGSSWGVWNTRWSKINW